MRIAIQGELGSFSHEAALKLEPQATIVPCAFSAEVFKRLHNAEVGAAVIPIENSLAGSVVEHFDLLFNPTYKFNGNPCCASATISLACRGVRLRIFARSSHPIALAQCRRFFDQHSRMTPTPFYDTAGSVKHIIGLGAKETGAIASEQAALAYGGEVLVPASKTIRPTTPVFPASGPC